MLKGIRQNKVFWGESPGNQSHTVMPFRTLLFSVAFCVSDNFNMSYQYLWCWETVDAFTLAAIVLWCWCCQDAPQQIGANVRAISISLLICTSRKEYHSQASSWLDWPMWERMTRQRWLHYTMLGCFSPNAGVIATLIKSGAGVNVLFDEDWSLWSDTPSSSSSMAEHSNEWHCEEILGGATSYRALFRATCNFKSSSFLALVR